MKRNLSIGLFLACVAGSAQSIPPFQVQTSSYRLHMFNHGNHAVNVAGLWMPGNICLTMHGPDGGFVQYKSADAPELELTERRTEDGVEIIVIKGMLGRKLRFTQTTRCADLKMTTTYEVEALTDLRATTITITAGPGPRKLLNGLHFSIHGPKGETTGTFPASPAIRVDNPARITWPDLGHRTVSFVFVKAAAGNVVVTDQGVRYEADLLRNGDLKAGGKLTGSCAVVIEFDKGFTGILPWSEGHAGPIRFDVDGANGMVHHLRTEYGNLIERLNLNEKAGDRNRYQSSAGRDGPGWSGVAEMTPPAGADYRGQVSGTIINEWRETVTARRIERGGQVDVTYHRVRSKQAANLRLLIYMAQRLEDRGQPFMVVPAAGGPITSISGQPTTIGMRSFNAEKGLGPYTDICRFKPGDRIVIPLLERGETLTLRSSRPATLAAFRFEVYFRGLWLDFDNDDAADVTLTLAVAEMPRRQGPGWSAPVDERTGAFAVTWGGMPLIDGVMPYAGLPAERGEPFLDGRRAKWRYEMTSTPDGLRQRWRRPAGTEAAGLVIDLPLELVGRTVEVLGPNGQPRVPPLGTRRIGAELPAETLAAGCTLVINRTAREQVRLGPDFDCRMTLGRKIGDGARLRLAAAKGAGNLGLDVRLATIPARPMRFDTPDPRATDSGLRAMGDGDDVLVVSPWWQVRQSAANGGCVSSVVFFYGSGRNVLVQPSASYVTTAGGSATTLGSRATLQIVEQSPERVVVRAIGALAGKLRVPYVATCEYRTGYMRQKWEYDFGDGVTGVTRFGVQRLDIRPELDEYLGRRLTRRTQRGRAVFPGATVFEEASYARYLCLFQRGVEGIEWLSATSVPQWRSQLGEQGHARYAIAAGDHTPGAGNLIIEPWADAEAPITISGTKTFEWISGLANIPPQLDRRYFITALRAPDEAMVRHAAYAGATVLHLGAGNWPGSFKSSDPKGSKRIVGLAHRYGMKIYPFDAHALLHRSVRKVSAEQRERWGTERLDGKGRRKLWVYSAYGDYMCDTARGWRDFMEHGYAGMMADYGYDGLYYDFVHPILCYNDRHCPVSPHLSSDGVLALCEWTAHQVGPDGVFSGHTGWVPTIACKNYCTVDTVYEEIGDDQVPALGRMPEQAQFVNARPKRLVSSFLWNSCLSSGESKSRSPRPEDVRAYTARCALLGVFPSPRNGDVSTDMRRAEDAPSHPFVRLMTAARALDLTRMEFADWRRQSAVACDNAHLRAAVFWNADRALVFVSNSESAREQSGAVRMDTSAFGWPREGTIAIVPLPTGRKVDVLTTRRLAKRGVPLALGGYDFTALLLTRLRQPGSTVFCTRPFTEKRTAGSLRVATTGPTGQTGRMMLWSTGRPPTKTTVDGKEATTTKGRLTAVEFAYMTSQPVVVEIAWGR